MTEQELRAIVREAIARHAAAQGSPQPAAAGGALTVRQHPSHGMFVVADGSSGDGPCLIEPAVTCNHCGYCKSYGH